MADYAVMPVADYQNACKAVREKDGSTADIKSGELAGKIRNISTGTKVWKETGNFTTNYSGKATVSGLGFQPDLVAVDGGTDVQGGKNYPGAMFTEAGLSSVNLVVSGPSSSYIVTALSLTRNSGGFSVTATKYSTSFEPSNDTNRKFSYVAIKYTD